MYVAPPSPAADEQANQCTKSTHRRAAITEQRTRKVGRSSSARSGSVLQAGSGQCGLQQQADVYSVHKRVHTTSLYKRIRHTACTSKCTQQTPASIGYIRQHHSVHHAVTYAAPLLTAAQLQHLRTNLWLLWNSTRRFCRSRIVWHTAVSILPLGLELWLQCRSCH